MANVGIFSGCYTYRKAITFEWIRALSSHIEAGTRWPQLWQTTFACSWVKNIWIPIKISLKFVAMSPVSKMSALVQIMAWCRPDDKPLSEPRMVCLQTHTCVTRPQWVNIKTRRSFYALAFIANMRRSRFGIVITGFLYWYDGNFILRRPTGLFASYSHHCAKHSEFDMNSTAHEYDKHERLSGKHCLVSWCCKILGRLTQPALD